LRVKAARAIMRTGMEWRCGSRYWPGIPVELREQISIICDHQENWGWARAVDRFLANYRWASWNDSSGGRRGWEPSEGTDL